MCVALTLLTVIGRPPVARAQGGVRYVATNGMDDGNPCIAPGNPCATIQHAVDVADPDEEIHVAGGTYSDIHCRPAPTGYTGPDTITQVVYISQSLAIRGGYTATDFSDPPDPETYPTTLDAQGQARVIFIAGDISAELEGLRITGGNAIGLGGRGYTDVGGGMTVLTATVGLSNSHVFSNSAGYGGGFYVESGILALNGDSITSNSADIGGGLSLNSSALTLSNSTVNSNTAVYDGGGMDIVAGQAALNNNTIGANTAGYHGGGLNLIYSAATLYSNTLNANTSGDAGGGLSVLDSSDATLIGNIIASNTTSFMGGGLVADRSGTAMLAENTIVSNTSGTLGGGVGALYDSQLALSGNTLVANAASYGGGLVLLYDSTAVLTNNVIVGNQASIASSGLGIQYSSIYMLHTTVASNTGGDGSGIYISDGSTAALTNTILTNQTIGITTTAGSTATLDGVLWFGNGASTGGAGSIAVTNQYFGSPSLAADGYHLRPGSAAINRGVRAWVATDIDGQVRDTAPDLGADEYPLTTVIYLPIIMRDR